MSAPDPLPRPPAPPLVAARLAELLVRAAASLETPAPGAVLPAPAGTPVRGGRLNLGRVRQSLPLEGPVAVVAGFGTACRLGAPRRGLPTSAGSPTGRRPRSAAGAGSRWTRSSTTVGSRGRVTLDRQARAWLAVADPASFEVVAMPFRAGGVLLIPVEDFARRFEAVTW